METKPYEKRGVARRRKYQRRAVSILAAIVVFATTYHLILPAITLETDVAREEPGIVIEDAEQENAPETAELSAAEEAPTPAEKPENGAVSEEPEAAPAGEAAEVPETPDEANETDEPETAPAKGDVGEAEQAAEAIAAAILPAQSFAGETDAVKVTAEAPEGAFPAGTTMTVTAVRDSEIIDAVSDAVEGDVVQVQAVDITFYNADGEEIEPAKEISVTLASKVIAEVEEPIVVHVDDAGKAEVVEQVEQKAAEDEVVFKTDAFSVYAIVGTETIRTEFLSANGKTYDVTVNYAPDAEIPEGAKLKVTEYAPGSREYQAAYEAVTGGDEAQAETYLELSAVDISIVDQSGHKVEPLTPVTVKIEVKKLPAEVSAEDIGADVAVSVQHLKEDNGAITVETVADTNQLSQGTVALDQTNSNAVLRTKFTVDSFSIFTFSFKNNEGETRNFTVHYGYMENGKFVEFKSGVPVMSPMGYTEHQDGDDPNSTSYTINQRMYLVYDIENHFYHSAYYSEQETDTPTSGTRIYPAIIKSSNLCYQKYDATGNTTANNAIADNSHIYMIYQDLTPTQGGSAETQLHEMELDEPDHEKTLTDNRDGTYTLSLSVTGEVKENEDKTKADVIIILDRSGSMTYGGGGGKTRWAIAKSAITDLTTQLLLNNTDEKKDLIRVSLITFSSDARVDVSSTTDAGDISKAMDGITAAGNTNWEYPLRLANSLPVRQNAETYIIFFTDGVPNQYLTRGDKVTDQMIDQNQNGLYHENNAWNNYNQFGVFGNGDDNGRYIVPLSYSKSVPAAQSIVAQGKHFYVIAGFGAESTMRNLVNEAYGKQEAAGTYYKSAANQTELRAAFNSIISDINSTFGYTGITITDGVTEFTNLTAKTSVAGAGSDSTFTYTRSGGYMGDHVIYPEGTVWKDAPEAKYENGNVVWDLEDTLLEDGVTYKVSFLVWPSQDCYDLIADLNNEDKTYDELKDTEKNQIVYKEGKYYLKTNEDNPSLSYQQYTKEKGEVTETSDPKDATPYQNPDPVILTSTQMTFKKVWNDSLDTSQRPAGPITFHILRDGEEYKEVTLSDGNDWKYEFYVSPGLKAQGITYDTGHLFTATEDNVDSHYELRAEEIRPMLVDSNSVITLVGDGDTGTESADGYLTAYNDLKGRINLTKAVVTPDGENVPWSEVKDETFTITGSLLDKNGAAYTSAKGNALEYWLYYAPNDDAAHDDADPEHPERSTKYTLADSGSFSFTLHQGETVRFVDVPAGTTWNVSETNLADQYSLVGITDGNEGNAATGTVTANTAHTVKVTNLRIEFKVKLLKVENGNEDQLLEGAVFQLYSAYDANDPTKNVVATHPDGSAVAAVTTGEDGTAALGGIGAGTYYLVETKAPAGYNTLTAPVTVQVTDAGVTYIQSDYSKSQSGEGLLQDADGQTFTLTVADSAGTALPRTGGIGTLPYTLTGLALIAAAGLMYGLKRRRREGQAD